MFDPEAEIPVDPREEEAVKKFLFSPVAPEERQVPSTSPGWRSRSVDPVDRRPWGLGAVHLPHNPKPRLVKHNFARR
ncbi:MAG: hypothetical protein G01um10142_528 [Parcubacteria group bacterium Gr01-1014_2]|nr:MAG: hypothetical protein G01um10142_528 [Parcubacteria group bacterium Gr01-1014_2]